MIWWGRTCIGVITHGIRTRTCTIGDGNITRTRHSLSPSFSSSYPPSPLISLSCPWLYYHLRTPSQVIPVDHSMPCWRVHTEFSILWVRHTPSKAYSEYSILWVQHTPSTAYSEYSILRVQHTPSTAYSEYSILRVQYTPRTCIIPRSTVSSSQPVSSLGTPCCTTFSTCPPWWIN